MSASVMPLGFQGSIPANIDIRLGIKALAGMIHETINPAIEDRTTRSRMPRVKNGSLLIHARMRAGFGNRSATEFAAIERS